MRRSASMLPAARHLLRARDLSDERYSAPLDVALEVGFRSAAAFCTAFRDVTGTTPAAYRRLASPEWLTDMPSCVLMAWTRPVLEVSRNAKTRALAAR